MQSFFNPARNQEAHSENPELILNNIKTSIRSLPTRPAQTEQLGLFLLECEDVFITLPHVFYILKLYYTKPNTEEWKVKISELLKERSQRIMNTALCYTLNNQAIMNDVCINLAKLLNPKKVPSLLFPDVAAEDIYGNNIDELSLGQFILKDDKSGFISLSDIVDTVFNRLGEDEAKPYVTTTSEGQQRDLSPDEMRRLGSIYLRLEDIRLKMKSRGFIEGMMKRKGDSIYKELLLLRDGLREGDAQHNGEEMNAGSQANIAIVNFRQFYERLTPAQKEDIRNLRGGNLSMGEILDRIFRDPTEASQNAGTDVIYCLAINGREMESVIKANSNSLRNVSDSKEQCIHLLKLDIVDTIKNKTHMQPANFIADNVENSLALLQDHVNATILAFVKIEKYARTLTAFNQYIREECTRRLNDKNLDDKLACYLNISYALGLMAYQLDGTPDLLIEMQMQEIFKRLHLLSTSTTRSVYMRKPTSISNWKNFVDSHPVLLEFHQLAITVTPCHYISEYLKQHPVEEQCQISSRDIRAMHEQIKREQALQAERERVEAAQRERERFRAQVIGFFKRTTPPAIATAAVAYSIYRLLT